MKVLHVIDRMDPKLGGVCQAVRTMIHGLGEMGIYNEVVSLDSPDAPFISIELFPIHALGPGKGPWSYSSKFFPWLIKNLSIFDTIILHGLWLYNGYALHKALQKINRKRDSKKVLNLYVMPHGMLDPYFQRAPGRKLKALRNWVYWKIFENKVINQSVGVLFTCEEERRLAHESFHPYNPKRELVVGLGVEEPPIRTATMHQAFQEKCFQLQDQPYILFLSRIHEKKGVDILIKAYIELASKMVVDNSETLPGTNMSGDEVAMSGTNSVIPKLVIAGPGLDTPFGMRMQKLVSEYKELQNVILFPGMLFGDAKWGAFYGCEAFILPSHQENFGIAIVEALACSKPVLISDQVNIWREIEAGGGGMIATNTQKGTLSLLEKWQTLSMKQKQSLINNARITYEKYFSIKPSVTKLLNLVSCD